MSKVRTRSASESTCGGGSGGLGQWADGFDNFTPSLPYADGTTKPLLRLLLEVPRG